MNVRRYQKLAKSGLAIMLARHDGRNSGIRWRDDCTGKETESSDTVSTQKAVTSDAIPSFYGKAYYIGSYITNDRSFRNYDFLEIL